MGDAAAPAAKPSNARRASFMMGPRSLHARRQHDRCIRKAGVQRDPAGSTMPTTMTYRCALKRGGKACKAQRADRAAPRWASRKRAGYAPAQAAGVHGTKCGTLLWRMGKRRRHGLSTREGLSCAVAHGRWCRSHRRFAKAHDSLCRNEPQRSRLCPPYRASAAHFFFPARSWRLGACFAPGFRKSSTISAAGLALLKK